VCAGVLLLAAVACSDSPTSPAYYTLPAAGELWTAVLVPRGVPDASTWTPYLRASRSDSDSAVREVRSLQISAEQLRREGSLAPARAAEERAALLAAHSLLEAPPQRVFLGALNALGVWSEHAGGAAEANELPDLQRRVSEVRALRASAVALLQQGDSVAAAVDLASAAAIARSQAPEAVAERVLARAEERIAAGAKGDHSSTRALRLLRHSREALAAGDHARALQRAFYALQLADGQGAPEPAN
jgi:hypothetical protein